MSSTSVLVPRAPEQLALGPGLGIHSTRQELDPAPPRLSFPDVRSLPEGFVQQARTSPDAIAYFFVDLEERLSYLTRAELLVAAQRVATALRARGVTRGERVMISFDTSPELVASFLACGLLGATPVPAYPPSGVATIAAWQDTLSRMMRSAGARGAIVDSSLLVASTAVVDQFKDGFAISPAEFPAQAEEITPPAIQPDELAFVQFTSGTTNIPKGVAVPQASLLANGRNIGESTLWHQGDQGVIWLPLYHDMGLVGGALSPLLFGFPVTLLSPMLFLFRPRRWLWLIHHFRGTLTVAPNFAFGLCVDRVKEAETEGLDLSSWRVAWNGAEFINPDTIQKFMRRYEKHGFPSTTMYPVYGMAETVLAATFPSYPSEVRFDTIHRELLVSQGRAIPASPGDPDAMTLVCCGHPFPGHQLRVEDERGRLLPDRRQGEIALKGPSLARGYINAPEATAAVFRNGWFYTGDKGYLVDGELFVCGRIKDLIIKAGRNYYPYDIEIAAARVEGVRIGNVAAFAVPNRKAGTEDIVLVFETRLNDPERVKQLVRAVELEVAHAIGVRPDKVVAVPPQTLPKTSSGKLKRGKIRELYLAQSLKPGGRRGQGKLGIVRTMAATYLRYGVSRLRRVPLLGRLVDLAVRTEDHRDGE